MRVDDFFVEAGTGAFGGVARAINSTLLTELRKASLSSATDAEAGVALARLVHDDLERYGTDGATELTEEEIRVAIRRCDRSPTDSESRTSICRFVTTPRFVATGFGRGRRGAGRRAETF